MRRLILAAALLPCLGLPALAQNGARTATSSGVVTGQNWSHGQDLRSSENIEAQRRAEILRRVPQRNYSGLPTRTRGIANRRSAEDTVTPAAAPTAPAQSAASLPPIAAPAN